MRKMLLLVVLLLAACSSAPNPSATPSPSPVPGDPTLAPRATGPAPSVPAADEWRVLAEQLWLGQSPFAVRAATGLAEFERLWADLGQAGSPPAIEFEREVVLYLGISGSSSCPEQLIGLVVDHQNARVYGEWRRNELRACTDDLAPQGVLIAVRRDVLPDQVFLLSLREQPICLDCPDHPDQLFVDPSATASR